MSIMAPAKPQPSLQDAVTNESRDMSQFIRTYAKDVAAQTGKGNVGAIALPKPTPVPVPPPAPRTSVYAEPVEKKGIIEDGVEFAAVEEPFFEKVSSADEDPYRMAIDVPSKAELDSEVLERTPTPPPTSVPEESRESILARLKEKMAVRPASVPVLPPAPPAPAIQVPVPPPAPVVFEPIPVPVPPPAPLPTPVFMEPVAPVVLPMPPVTREPVLVAESRVPFPKSEPAVVDNSDRFHSYSTDFADQVTEKKASPFTILAAQVDKAPRAQASVSVSRKRPTVAIALGLILLTVAAVGSYGAYRYTASRHALPTVISTVPSLVVADEFKKLSGTGVDLLRALAMATSDTLVPGNVLVTYIEQPATGEPGIIAGTPAPGGLLVRDLNLPAPDILLRNIAKESTVGSIHAGSESRAFFVLRVSSYERTFAGMLTWEPLMSRDLALLYPLYSAQEPVPVSLATGSSTPIRSVSQVPAASTGRFTDTIVSNRDVRILRDTAGHSLMLYGYADKETLIIARDETAFTALLTRLQSGAR